MATKQEDWSELVEWLAIKIEELQGEMKAHEEHQFLHLREAAYYKKRAYQAVLDKMEKVERRTEKIQSIIFQKNGDN